MAGRPLGLRRLVRLLGVFSPAQIKSIIAQARRSPKEDAVERLELKREKHLQAVKKLDRQIAELTGGNGAVATPNRQGRKPGRKKGYKLSAATRRKMSEAAKRRYAGKGKPEAPAPGKKRRTMSPETRAKMAEAAKRRWANVAAQAKPVEVK